MLLKEIALNITENISLIRKSLEKNSSLPNKTKVCLLAKLKKDEKGFEFDSAGEAVCFVKDGVAHDLLSDEKLRYNVYNSLSEIRADIKSGKLQSGNIFSLIVLDAFELFPELKDIYSKDDIIKYLEEYNIKNNTSHYWTFLDEDQVTILDEIAKENYKKYDCSYY